MTSRIKFSLPIYMGAKKDDEKTRKRKSSAKPRKSAEKLVGMNSYRNMHYRTNNALKKRYHDIIEALSISGKIRGRYSVHYTYFYRNKLSDTPNVCSVIDKYTLDALQTLNIVQQDNVEYLAYVKYITGTQDRLNPRVEVEIIPEEELDGSCDSIKK